MKRLLSGQCTHRQAVGTVGLTLALVATVIWLQSCAATPKQFSYLDGYRWSTVEVNTFDTLIVSVDGKSYTYNSKIMVDPGPHRIVFQTAPTPGFSFSPQKELMIDIAPCTRYWFEAKKANTIAQDFEPRVNYTLPIIGCGDTNTAMRSGGKGY